MSDFGQVELDISKMTEGELSALEQVVRGFQKQEEEMNPLKGFIPNGAIEELIKQVGDTEKMIYLMPAANSLGKTAASVAVLANIMWGPQNRWFDHTRFRKWPEKWPKRFWYISEQTTLRGTVCGIDEASNTEIRKWFPKGRYRFTKSDYPYFSELTTDTGWSGSFKSFDQEPKKFASEKISVAIFDEPPPEAIYNEVMARLMLGGVVIMPMTPLYTAAWTAERLVEHQGDDIWVMPEELSDIEINCRQHGIRGILDHEQIQRIVSKYDEDEREARTQGKYMYLKGLVYKGLHPDVHRHRLAPVEFNQDEFKIYCVVDPHTVRPDMIGWFAVQNETGLAYAVGEFPSQPEFPPFHLISTWNFTTKEVALRIKEFEEDAGWDGDLITRIMDPNFGKTKKGDTGLTTQEVFRKCGKEIGYRLNFTCDVNDDLMSGHRIVREYIHVDKVDGKLVTHFRIGEACPNIWHGMTHYKWAKTTGLRADHDGQDEKVEKKHKDGPDVVRYFFMFYKGPRARKQKEEEDVPEHYRLYDAQVRRIPKGDWRDPYSV